MKFSNKSLLSGVLILAIGVVLIICHNMITGQGIVVLAGILFLLTGIINLIIYVTQKDENGRLKTRGLPLVFGWLVSLAAMILGLCMLVFNDTFNQMIPFIFGLLVFFGAVMLIYTMVFSVRKVVTPPGWLWLFPAAMVILAIIVAAQPATSSDPLIMLLTGIAMIIFGVDGVIMGIITSHARHAAAAHAAHPASAPEDVTAKELKSNND